MAIDALSIPFDITWQRLAWSTDMLDRSFGGTLPPKWRSSMAVYVYPVPLADTTDDYPDHRIVYLKLSASVTGWSPRETIEGHLLGNPGWDAWRMEGWNVVAQSPSLTRTYWSRGLCSRSPLSLARSLSGNEQQGNSSRQRDRSTWQPERSLQQAEMQTK